MISMSMVLKDARAVRLMSIALRDTRETLMLSLQCRDVHVLLRGRACSAERCTRDDVGRDVVRSVPLDDI
jgi:hypothetical protein